MNQTYYPEKRYSFDDPRCYKCEERSWPVSEMGISYMDHINIPSAAKAKPAKPKQRDRRKNPLVKT